MAYNIGINVIETEGSASPAIAGAPTSVAGLILRSRRGPTDRAVRVSSFQQFAARFGAHDRRFTGAYAVEGFFANGGREAWIARVVDRDAAAAAVTLRSRAGADTLTVTAGYRGASDVGSWGNELHVDIRDNPEVSTQLAATLAGHTPARLTGTALTGTVDLSGLAAGDVFSVVVDGAPKIDVAFNGDTLPVPAKASLGDVLAAINAQSRGAFLASAKSGAIELVSRSKGKSSSVSVAASNAALRRTLGFADGSVSASGADGAGTGYTRVQVRSIAGLRIGDVVRLSDGITEDWLTVTGLEDTTDSGGQRTLFVQFAEPPAARRNQYRVDDGASLSTPEFDLVVTRRGDADTTPVLLETWEKLTLAGDRPRYAPRVVNDAASGSTRITLADTNTGSFSGPSTPAPARAVRLGLSTPTTTSLTRVQGSDGDTPGAVDYRGALGRFDTIAIQLLAVPEDMDSGLLRAVSRACIDYCAGPVKGDCMFVGHTASSLDLDAARGFGQELRASKVYGALYWPWITVTDPAGGGPNPTRTIPPTGHVLGVYARIDQTRGVWKAPAGNEAVVLGALSVERDITDIDHTDLVKNGSINGIRNIRGAGIVVDASRTLSTDTRWLYVNVRLLFNYVKASLRDGLRWVKQEPNRESLWNKIRYNAVIPFLRRLYQQGAFGPGTERDVYTVICGAENNPPEEITLGNLRVEVYFYPSRPAETIVIEIGQQDGRSAASES